MYGVADILSLTGLMAPARDRISDLGPSDGTAATGLAERMLGSDAARSALSENGSRST
jgi:hypothetical protein